MLALCLIWSPACFRRGRRADVNSDFGSKRAAVGTFEHNLTIRRVGLTYVVNISFQSLSPARAAEIANAVASAYIDDQLEAKFDSARRAGSWLQARLRELRDQASTAERAVVAFKNKNEMVDTGGRTINEQQLAELNSELVLARSKTAEAKARAGSRRSSPAEQFAGHDCLWRPLQTLSKVK